MMGVDDIDGGDGACVDPLLSRDCIASVLSSLTHQADRKAAALVCKEWLRVALSTWTVRFFSRPGLPSVGLRRLLFVFGGSLTSASFDPSAVEPDALSALASHCRLLTRISMRANIEADEPLGNKKKLRFNSPFVVNMRTSWGGDIPRLGVDELATIGMGFPLLRELDLSGCNLELSSSSSASSGLPCDVSKPTSDGVEHDGNGDRVRKTRDAVVTHISDTLPERCTDVVDSSESRSSSSSSSINTVVKHDDDGSFPPLPRGVLTKKKKTDDVDNVSSSGDCNAPLAISDRLIRALIGRGEWCLRHLESIDLDQSSASVSDEGILELSKRCPKLRDVGLPRVHGVLDDGLRGLSRSCPSLERLSIHGDQLISYVGLRSLASGCGQLRHLSLGVTTAEVNEGLSAVLCHCATLRELQIVRITSDLGARVISAIALYGHRLQLLDVFSIPVATTASDRRAGTSSDCWIKAAAGCGNLARLCFRDCPEIKDSHLQMFATSSNGSGGDSAGFRKLTALTLVHANLSGSGLLWVKEGCRQSLRELDLTHSRVTNLGRLVEGGQWISMEVINLEGCEQIDDDDVAAIAAACPNLRLLNITECMAVSDAGLKRLARGGGNVLEELDMRRTPRITGQGFGAGFPRLQKLRVTHGRLDENGLAAIGSGCLHLNDLSINSCFKVTNKGLSSLIHCTNLKKITLENCCNISVAGIWEVVSRCVDLCEVAVSSCKHITPHHESWLMQQLASKRRGDV